MKNNFTRWERNTAASETDARHCTGLSVGIIMVKVLKCAPLEMWCDGRWLVVSSHVFLMIIIII